MEIFFVRHGQSSANVTGHWQGHGDSQLSDAGREQTAALAERLKDEHFDLVVSSDLSRAADTARALGREVELDKRFREVDVGAWEGLTRPEVMERFPENVLDLRAGKPVKIGGGESWDEMHARASEALDSLIARLDEHGRAIVFTHGGVIAGLFAGFIEARDQVMGPLGRVDNTGVSAVHVSDQGRRISRFNDSAHRGPMGHYAREALEAGASITRLLVGEPAKSTGAAALMERYASAESIAAEAGRTVESEGVFAPPATGTRTDLMTVKGRVFLVAYAATRRA
ncbi:MAG: histidine phosphatase family protein [Deltaproteobacteria bacterium]|nr:histidine phosphatase family protein [Deltaproteobacteria bacterium]